MIGRVFFHLVVVCSVIPIALFGYNIDQLDSLATVLVNEQTNLSKRLVVLKQLSDEHNNPDDKLYYSNQLVSEALSLDSISYIISGYLQIGRAQKLKGNLAEALEALFTASEVALSHGLKRDFGLTQITIADIYSVMESHDDAVNYYKKGIDILIEESDSLNVASAMLNLGDEYINDGLLDSALVYFLTSGEIFDKLNYELGKAYNLGNIGLVNAQKGLTEMAEIKINEAVHILEKIEDYYPICIYLNSLSDIYLEKGNSLLALKFAKRSEALAYKYGLKQEISDANYKLYQIHMVNMDHAKALNSYKNFVAYRDSVNNIAMVKETSRLRADFEISQKQLEVDLLREKQQSQKIGLIASVIVGLSIGLLALGLYMRYRYIAKTSSIINEEKNRSEELLLNILPQETAEELKLYGQVKAKRFESVTVMFTDFVSFSKHAENMPPEKLVERVDFYFSKFDNIMDKYDIEKIKTVGDAYLCVCGLPYPSEDHAFRMIHAAIEIIDIINEVKENEKNEVCFDVRVGIHTGPVVAGVVGSKKFAYDIWGDTVNVASRMESHAAANSINLSQSTYDFIKDSFDFEFRGEIDIKNRTNINMYYVKT